MKIVSCRVGGERRVGLVDEPGRSVSPFDAPEAEVLFGVVALISRPSCPASFRPSR
jgi:hypothetical protein